MIQKLPRFVLAFLLSPFFLTGLTGCSGNSSALHAQAGLAAPAMVRDSAMRKFYAYEFNGLPPKEIPAGEYSADQILNGQAPGRKASPPVKLVNDASGFDSSRLFHVPPPGVHPRLYFGPKDLPGIRERLSRSNAGRQFIAFMRDAVKRGIDQPGTQENALYTDLLRGDMKAFTRLYNANSELLQNYLLVMGSSKGFKELYGDQKIPPFITQDGKKIPTQPAVRFFLRNSFREELMFKAWLALLDNDPAEGRKVGTAMAGYMTYLKPLVLRVNAGLFGQDFWRTMKPMLGGLGGTIEIACTYDWDYNFMTPAQRDTCREVIADMTHGHYTLGMDLPDHWINWNFIGMAQYFDILSLSIEGEKGYDPRIYTQSVRVVKDFLKYGFDDDGFAKEAVGYSSAGMQHLSSVMLALAVRGDNFFTLRRYHRYFDNYMLWTLLPQGRAWRSEGDLGDFPPTLESVMMAKYFYPDDPKLDYVFQNLPDVQADNFKKDYFFDAILACVADPIRTADGQWINHHHGADFHLPDTLVDADRGWLFARTGWNTNALYLQFTARNDIMDASHNHADGGRLVVNADGCEWTYDYHRQTKDTEQSEVLIDGKGQGFFPTPAKWLGAADDHDAAFGACDLSYCYDWRWEKQILMWSPDDPRLDCPAYAGYKPQILEFQNSGDRAQAEYDPSAGPRDYYSGYLAGDPKMWDQDSWVVRLPYNSVKYAYRTAGLVRGDHPYVLVVDDIQKDDKPHLYTWQLMLNPQVTQIGEKAHDGFEDVILGMTDGHGHLGDNRLLVRVLMAENSGQPVQPFLREYAEPNAFGQALRMKKLVVPADSVCPKFKVLIYPFRAGQELPATQWSGGQTQLTVRFPGQEDHFEIRPAASGRSSLAMHRNEQNIFSLP